MISPRRRALLVIAALHTGLLDARMPDVDPAFRKSLRKATTKLIGKPGETRKQRRDRAQAEFDRIHKGVERDLAGHLSALRNGQIPGKTWTAQVNRWRARSRETLKAAYQEAYRAGHIASGGSGALTANDLATINRELRAEWRYLAKFSRQLADPEYLATQGAVERAGMYADAVRGMYNAGFVASVPDDAEIYWRVSPQCQHCPDCLSMAGGPYRKPGTIAPEGGAVVGKVLDRMPGSGWSKCLCITTPHSRILTKRGLVPISEVTLDDEVWTHRARWRSVVARIRSVPAPDHRQAWIRGVSGELVGCTDDHMFLTPLGWKPLLCIDKCRLLVYNTGYGKAMRQVRGEDEERPEDGSVLSMLPDMPLRGTEGSQGVGMSGMLEQENGPRAMAESYTARSDRCWNPSGRDEAESLLCGPDRDLVHKQEDRRTSLCQVPGREREELLGLPIPLVMGTDKRADPDWDGTTPQERGQGGRPIGEPGTDHPIGPRAAPHDGCPNRRDSCGEGDLKEPNNAVDMRTVRKGVLAKDSEAPWIPPPEILFTGMLQSGTTLYDIEVEDDHSFVVEGLVAHNSSCKCWLEYRGVKSANPLATHRSPGSRQAVKV